MEIFHSVRKRRDLCGWENLFDFIIVKNQLLNSQKEKSILTAVDLNIMILFTDEVAVISC